MQVQKIQNNNNSPYFKGMLWADGSSRYFVPHTSYKKSNSTGFFKSIKKYIVNVGTTLKHLLMTK